MESVTHVLISATSHIVLLLTLLPACGAVLVHLSRRADSESVYYIALTNAWTGQFLTVVMLVIFTTGTLARDSDRPHANQLVSSLVWHAETDQASEAPASPDGSPPVASQPPASLQGPPIRILMGADGFSVWLMALTVAISVVLIHSQPRDHERLSIRLSWTLLTESALLGSIAALDIILLSFTSLLSVTGISFLIAESGDRSRREAARRFFIVQLASGVLLMIGLTGIAVSHWWMQLNEKMQHPVLTFSLTTLQEQIPQLAESSQPALEFWNTLSPWLFLIIGCALLIRLPIPPLHHNWLRVAEHADRRVAALIVAGYLPLTMHLLLRVLLPLFPAQSAALAGRLALWGVAGSLFLSLVAAATPCRQRRLATVALSGTTAAAGTCFLQQPTIIQGAALTTVALAAACALTVLCRTRSGPGLSSRRQAPTVPRVPTALLQGIPIFALAGLSLMPLTAGFWGGLLILEGLFSFDPTLALVLLISFGLSGWTIQAELLRQPGLSFRPQQTAPVRHTEKPGLQHVSVATLIPLAVIFATLSLCPRLVLDQRSAPDSERREAHLKVSRPDSRSHRIPGTLTMPRGVKRITTAK